MDNEYHDNPSESTQMIDVLEDLINENKEIREELVVEQPKKKKKKDVKEEKNVFKSMSFYWHNLPKKKKTIILIIVSLLLVLIILLVLFLANLKKQEPTPLPIEEETPKVIVEEENYRYEDGSLIFLDASKNELGSYKCTNEDDALCYVAYFDNTDDTFDTPKILAEDGKPWQERTKIFLNKYVFIVDAAKNSTKVLKLYNIDEKKVENEYLLVKKNTSNENIVILKDTSSKYGVIEFTETNKKEKISFTYDYIGNIPTNNKNYIAIATKRNLLLDENGKSLTKTIPGAIKNYNDKYITAIDSDNIYHIYDYEGKEILKDENPYDYIELYKDYAALIRNKMLYLKSYKDYKLNEEPIRLKNDYYQKELTYSSEGMLVDTKESFNLNESNKIITISINGVDEVTTINTLEGKLSKDLAYVNYFNNTLYIYRDSEKKSLLGSYKCTNANVITDETTTLDNCSFAYDTIYDNNELTTTINSGIIPIFNEKFVFIRDNPTDATNENYTIILYDLTKRQSLSRYRSVSTKSNTGNELTFKDVNNYEIMACNKNGYYGVIKLNASGVAPFISFDYEVLETIDEFYQVKTNEGYYLITNNEKITKPIPNKIMNYTDTYLTAIDNNNNYHLYDYEGNKISGEDTYTYIGMYNNFYVTVKNNHLELYKYDDNKTNLLETAGLPTLNLTKYYGKGTLAFKISENGSRFTIKFGDKNDTYKDVYNGDMNKFTEETEENEGEENALS